MMLSSLGAGSSWSLLRLKLKPNIAPHKTQRKASATSGSDPSFGNLKILISYLFPFLMFMTLLPKSHIHTCCQCTKSWCLSTQNIMTNHDRYLGSPRNTPHMNWKIIQRGMIWETSQSRVLWACSPFHEGILLLLILPWQEQTLTQTCIKYTRYNPSSLKMFDISAAFPLFNSSSSYTK